MYRLTGLQFRCGCGDVRLDRIESTVDSMRVVIGGLIGQVNQLQQSVKRLERFEQMLSHILVWISQILDFVTS